MIAIDPPPFKTPVGAAIRMRSLSQFLSCASKAVGLRGEVSVLLTGDNRIRSLNRDFRGKNQATDVLSFPPPPPFSKSGQAGDLAISLDTALRQARERGHTLQIEVKVLILHGLLHLAGFDHVTDSGEMARREIRLRKQLALPAGLIEREDSKSARTPYPRKRPAAGTPRQKKNRRSQRLNPGANRGPARSNKSKGPRP